MVSILPPKRSPWQRIGEAMTKYGQNAGELQEKRYQRNQLQESLDKIKTLSKDEEASPLDLLLETMKAGAGIPGSEKYIGTLAPEIAKFAKARSANKVPLPGEETNELQRQSLPGFMNKPVQQNQAIPQGQQQQNGMGNLPQPATSGQTEPLLSPKEIPAAARKLAKQYTDAGIAMTPAEALPLIKSQEEEKKLNNATVEAERQQRVGSQQEYGQRAVDELKKVYKESTPEQEAIFQKFGEEEAGKGKSEADINKALAEKARVFSNKIKGVKNDISSPRLQNTYQRQLLGTDKDFNQATNDLRVKLRPILDMGLYDTARKLLTDLGYYPEERESIINPMSERLKTTMNKVPLADRKMKEKGFMEALSPQTTLFPNYEYSPNQVENVKSGIRDLQKADPNFSLVLGRKAFEDKNYDWRVYSEALNDLILNEELQLTPDQEIQKEYLDSPPLNGLERILHGIGIIGR